MFVPFPDASEHSIIFRKLKEAINWQKQKVISPDFSILNAYGLFSAPATELELAMRSLYCSTKCIIRKKEWKKGIHVARYFKRLFVVRSSCKKIKISSVRLAVVNFKECSWDVKKKCNLNTNFKNERIQGRCVIKPLRVRTGKFYDK